MSPLARHERWYHVPCPVCGKRARRETDVSDTHGVVYVPNRLLNLAVG